MSDTPTNTPTSPETDGGDERSGTRKRALRVLGSRMLSREALEKRLRELGETKTSAAEAADWLAGMGLIDDRELAREIARSYARRGFGARRIREELYRRLVPREYWGDALAELERGAEAASAEAYIEKKLRGNAASSDDRRRVSAALERRGFKWEDINAAWNGYDANYEPEL